VLQQQSPRAPPEALLPEALLAPLAPPSPTSPRSPPPAPPPPPPPPEYAQAGRPEPFRKPGEWHHRLACGGWHRDLRTALDKQPAAPPADVLYFKASCALR